MTQRTEYSWNEWDYENRRTPVWVMMLTSAFVFFLSHVLMLVLTQLVCGRRNSGCFLESAALKRTCAFWFGPTWREDRRARCLFEIVKGKKKKKKRREGHRNSFPVDRDSQNVSSARSTKSSIVIIYSCCRKYKWTWKVAVPSLLTVLCPVSPLNLFYESLWYYSPLYPTKKDN
jgi:hypothetical protein